MILILIIFTYSHSDSKMRLICRAEDGCVSRALPEVDAHYCDGSSAVLRRVLSTTPASGGFLRRVRGKPGRRRAVVASRAPLPGVYGRIAVSRCLAIALQSAAGLA
jgi:hypothetical protein